jgi:hypothetical protein
MLKFSQFLLIEASTGNSSKTDDKSYLKLYRNDLTNQIKDLGDLLKVSVGNRGEIERLKNELNLKQTELSNINTTIASEYSPSAPKSDSDYLPQPDQALRKSALEKLSGSNIPGDTSKTLTAISLGSNLPNAQATNTSSSLPTKAPSLKTSSIGSSSSSLSI